MTTARTVDAIRRDAAARLRSAGMDSPELDARLLLGAVLDLDLTGLISQAARLLTPQDIAALERALRRRIAGEPVARILGVREFWGLPFRLSPDTLVPRPDTETVIEAVLDIVRANAWQGRGLRILDVGTGSGAILLALLHELPDAFGVGIDISLGALRTACANAAALGLSARAAYVAGDYLAAIRGPFDLIVSNPPYVRTADMAGLSTEVRDHEPRRALDGGADGLAAYRVIATQAVGALVPGGALVLEIGQHQAADVERLTGAAGLHRHRPPRPDLGGVLRVVTARKPPP